MMRDWKLDTPEKRMVQARLQQSKGRIITCDVGRCIDCGGYTNSGMNAFCRQCADDIVTGKKT